MSLLMKLKHVHKSQTGIHIQQRDSLWLSAPKKKRMSPSIYHYPSLMRRHSSRNKTLTLVFRAKYLQLIWNDDLPSSYIQVGIQCALGAL